MKRILLSLSVLAMAYTANSQTLLSEDFDAMTVGDLGTQGNWMVYPSPLTEAQVVNIGTGDNALQLSGSSTDTGTKYVYKAIDWASRTAGNDVLFTEFIMQTGPATTSLNSFTSGFYDEGNNLSFGLKYAPSTNIVEGLIYDTDGTYLVTLSTSDVLCQTICYILFLCGMILQTVKLIGISLMTKIIQFVFKVLALLIQTL